MDRAPISQLLPCQPECWPLGSAWSGWTPFLTFSVFGQLRGSFTFPGSPALICGTKEADLGPALTRSPGLAAEGTV